MRSILVFCFFFFLSLIVCSQTNSKYTISFDNAIHHEAHISASFTNLSSDTVEVRMSRTSPGRYALHEFVKNVYDVKFYDENRNELQSKRPDPYSWLVTEHNGKITLEYTLFANRGDGTYSQIDETHAHLNIPATFMYVPELADEGYEIDIQVRDDLNWKIATQLKQESETIFRAENLQYFMDSPIEISDFREKSFELDGQTIRFILHDDLASDDDFTAYFDKVKKVVVEEKAVFGELPKFDYGDYKFLACYMPNASGDGMEHRNSTILTNTRSLANGGIKGNIGTVAHEFFHCWNVERIRPKALEPFDFEEANISGELWFAEGFTSYYDDLSLVRAGVISKEDYVKGLVGTFNYVWNSPGREYFSPIEMSYQAAFVDAARSVDEVNRGNTFISYYSYGSMLGLALDLALREEGLNLDDYMKLVWEAFGRTKKYYNVQDLNLTLNQYAGAGFADSFFQSYVYSSQMPAFENLLNIVGIQLSQDKTNIAFGAEVTNGVISSYPTMGSSAYEGGLDKGDQIVSWDGQPIEKNSSIKDLYDLYKIGDTVSISIERFGNTRELDFILKSNNLYQLRMMPSDQISKQQLKKQNEWLESKADKK